MLKEHGILLALIIHWVMYYFALVNNFMDWGFNGWLNYGIQNVSLPLMGAIICCVYLIYEEDGNYKLLNYCAYTFSIRVFIIIFKCFEMDNSGVTMVFCGICMISFFIYEQIGQSNRNNYFKH